MKRARNSKKPKVSIVVPIYKVEKYLNECVDSILRQTMKDIEVILVDDGSPDNCGKIVDEYAKKDSRVVAVHQENSGYSKAVNRGIEMARGEYIGIIESDDWVEDDMYESLYKNAKKNKTDVTRGMFFIYHSDADEGQQNIIFKNPNGVDLRLAPSGVFSAQDWPKIVAFHASLWSCIYKASFLKKIKIPETAGASYQDFPFIMEVYARAKRITVVKRPFVHWRNDANQGNSTSANGKKLLLMGENTLRAIEVLKKYDKLDALKEPFFAHAFWANYIFFARIDRKYRRKYYEKLIQVFSYIKDDPNFHYTYFTQFDKNKVKYFMEKNGYSKWLRKEYIHHFKEHLIRFSTAILPGYRMSRFIKDQNFDIMHQNELLMDEVLELRREVENLKQKK